jgi:hypothetical protein
MYIGYDLSPKGTSTVFITPRDTGRSATAAAAAVEQGLLPVNCVLLPLVEGDDWGEECLERSRVGRT